MKPIESSPKDGIVLFLILCSFHCKRYLCPAVVYYNDKLFLFILQGIRGDEKARMTTPHHPTTVLVEAMELCASAGGSDAEYRKPEARIYITARQF